jgi:hypothetical protein
MPKIVPVDGAPGTTLQTLPFQRRKLGASLAFGALRPAQTSFEADPHMLRINVPALPVKTGKNVVPS